MKLIEVKQPETKYDRLRARSIELNRTIRDIEKKCTDFHDRLRELELESWDDLLSQGVAPATSNGMQWLNAHYNLSVYREKNPTEVKQVIVPPQGEGGVRIYYVSKKYSADSDLIRLEMLKIIAPYSKLVGEYSHLKQSLKGSVVAHVPTGFELSDKPVEQKRKLLLKMLKYFRAAMGLKKSLRRDPTIVGAASANAQPGADIVLPELMTYLRFLCSKSNSPTTRKLTTQIGTDYDAYVQETQPEQTSERIARLHHYVSVLKRCMNHVKHIDKLAKQEQLNRESS